MRKILLCISNKKRCIQKFFLRILKITFNCYTVIIFVSINQSINPFISLFFSRSFHLSIKSKSLYIIHINWILSIYLSVCWYIYLHTSAYLCIPIYLSMYLVIWLQNSTEMPTAITRLTKDTAFRVMLHQYIKAPRFKTDRTFHYH